MGRARAHFGWIPDCSLKKTCPSVVHSKFSVMHYFKFTFSREMRSAKLSDTWRFEKGIRYWELLWRVSWPHWAGCKRNSASASSKETCAQWTVDWRNFQVMFAACFVRSFACSSGLWKFGMFTKSFCELQEAFFWFWNGMWISILCSVCTAFLIVSA